MAAKKSKIGGPRLGSGRPKGTGPGPSPLARRNRVTALFSDEEYAHLRALAESARLPVGTLLYQLASKALRRR